MAEARKLGPSDERCGNDVGENPSRRQGSQSAPHEDRVEVEAARVNVAKALRIGGLVSGRQAEGRRIADLMVGAVVVLDCKRIIFANNIQGLDQTGLYAV